MHAKQRVMVGSIVRAVLAAHQAPVSSSSSVRIMARCSGVEGRGFFVGGGPGEVFQGVHSVQSSLNCGSNHLDRIGACHEQTRRGLHVHEFHQNLPELVGIARLISGVRGQHLLGAHLNSELARAIGAAVLHARGATRITWLMPQKLVANWRSISGVAALRSCRPGSNLHC